MEELGTSLAEKDELSQSLLERIYYAAREGMAMTLYNLVSDKSQEQIDCLINQKVLEDDGQRCTPLIIAARYGRRSVVKILIDKFKPNLEEEGAVKFSATNYTIEGATALYSAVEASWLIVKIVPITKAAGHLTVVKILMKAGADVNHSAKSNSTPLRAACFEGHLDIVKYLMEHNADINIANKFNSTCLMIAAHKGHLDVVMFLLEQGVDPDLRANCGATALHFAAECGHMEIVAKLLSYGAKMSKNETGMSPLLVAAERMRVEVVKYLVRQPDVTKEEMIEAYELLGASYANDKDNYSLTRAYSYLHEAMELRYSDPKNIVRKNLGETIKAYEHWKECETLESLESIQNNQNSIHMESLAIKERILGPHNPEVAHPITFRGAVFADNARFDRSIDLWLHALKIRQLNNISIVKDLLRFAQVFSQMIHLGVDLDFPQVLSVLDACVSELGRNKTKLTNTDSKEYIDEYVDEMESNLTTTLYILTILTKILTLNGNRYEQKDVAMAHQLVHGLCALNVRLRDGQSLLHLAVNADTPVDDFHTNDVCKFPCAATAKLLIRCGANVNAMDNERNTPLHIIVNYGKPISDFTTLHSIIIELIEAGAHMDIVNSDGKTPYDAVNTGVAEIILRTQTKLSLQCTAAKVIKAYNLSYTGKVPRALEDFIELHGPGLM